jgi:tryptophan halogenase
MQQNTPEKNGRKPVRRVVIAGGGTAGWMAAAVISKILGKTLDITLVESDEIGTVGVGEATIPSLIRFHQLLELDEADFMRATQATFKLGISFENWRAPGEDYIHSFGLTGIDHWTAGFQHFWRKGRQRGLAGDFGDYCLELRSAQLGRFAHLPNDALNYAYHLDATLYAKFLRKFSEGFGVKRVEGKIEQVMLDTASRHVTGLRLDSGALVEGDLFIDCTGFRSLLLGQTLGVEYEDWSQWLFNDTAIAVQTELMGEPVPMTRSIARRLAVADPAAAPSRQWPRVLQQVHGQRGSHADLARQSARRATDAAARDQVQAGPAQADVERQRRRHRPVERLSGADRVDQHPPDRA